MIFLNAEVISGLGEDTFWTWFKREFPASRFATPHRLETEDVVLRYSTLGPLNVMPGRSVALLWELLPEMKNIFRSSEWDQKLASIYQCASQSTYRVVASSLCVPYYSHWGSVDVIPIGVDTEVFKPISEKSALRDKYGLPREKRIGIWGGTTHPMKGFERLKRYAAEHPDIHWVIVWKQPSDAGFFEGGANFTQLSQQSLAELFSASDFFLCCGMLQPFYMIEWEAMASNVPMVILDGMKKDFHPSDNPRDDIFRYGWDRPSVKRAWETYLTRKGVVC
jgi:glycosyltransferase involved in cell wall biosynthesis